MFYLQDILSSSGIRVEGFMGSQSPPGGLQAVHVAICTIEKANSLVNKLLDEGNITDLGAIIVDELHLLGDPSRGYILELLLTKIKYVSSNSEEVQIQIVGMSATLPNLESLANWLDAELFITQFRPIPLDEYCLVGNKYYDKQGVCVNTIDMSLTTEGDNVLKICLETIQDGCSILIFCMTKNWCESLAQSVASSFYKLGCEDSEAGSVLRSQLKSDNILEVLEQLKNCPVGLDQVLKKTISFGVAYHHAGLTFDERDIVEGGFKSGAIRVLVATSTLSSGVNLPARKVIIRSPVFQRQPINILTYKQMIGRAGRMGRDTKGESVLICTEAEKKIGFDLMMGSLDPVKSCIESEDKYMRAVLEMIASQVVCTKEQLDLYSKCTLLYNQEDKSATQNCLLENTLEELKNFELVRIQTEGEEEHFIATPLGKACLSSSMAPNDGLSLFCELQKARQCLVLETDLHLIYLVTPYSVSSQWGNIDWIHMLTLWESLTKAMKRVGELVGVQESFIIRCLRGGNKPNNIQNKVNIHKRFYTALALQDLVNEVPLADVAMKFQCARGFLQSLQQGAATFAGMVTAFCRQLGWKNMEMLISQFQDRLHFGIHSELLELMKLPSLNEWLIDSSEKIPEIDYLTKKYCGIDFTKVLLKVGNQQKRFKNLDTSEGLCLKAWALWMVAENQEKALRSSLQPARSVIDIENQIAKILANCEYYGIIVDKNLASRLLIDVRNSQESLQKKAYKLCGYHFNFNSSKDVAKALGIYNGRKVSTKKSVLSSHNSPLSSTVIYWRKLNSILTKTLYPLTEKACIYTEGDRINPTYTMFSCTGRISMHEPNLQNVPRTFSIPVEYLHSVPQCHSDDVVEFNCRNIFKAAPGHVIVSADYCQLEMRILTHFCKDQVLMNIMNSDMDVFKSIAASWGNLPEEEVDDDLRQKAKQLCYGIIYGMGNKTLGQVLDVSEMEAAVFMDSFYKTYPAVRVFTRSVIDECRAKGYVETLTKRRRYLPEIKSIVGAKKSAAERQAVNTTIQGSAADIAKAAMCSIDSRTDRLEPKPRLILQMHDELIYEVPEKHQHHFINIMKQVMEETVKLRVPLPVKVKSGLTWGSLKEIKF
ncbi:hypothetical protein PYW07_001532 [Mythimna separata]|uniref:DNA polymerase theta n=1 Tax=Mythimna separata TaxID=271217 RepID=A0AAD8DW22_MYTSE|nr:hypothetical protein PYW07_001532 [Mythimna separata]